MLSRTEVGSYSNIVDGYKCQLCVEHLNHITFMLMYMPLVMSYTCQHVKCVISSKYLSALLLTVSK